jgi:tol-pal system protein YbgF
VVVIRLTALVCAGGFLAACGAGQERTEKQLDAMQRQMQSLNDAAEANQRRITRLQDRVDLLEDKLEARSLHALPPGLPVVRVQPPASAAPRDEQPPIEITQDDLDRYEGRSITVDAGDDAAAAPVRRRRAPVPPPENAHLADNLGVVPMPGGAKKAEPVAAEPPPGDDPIGAYKRAYALYKSGDVGAALAGFSGFMERWPTHDYADNALYWMGECRYQRAEFAAALQLFRRVVDEHPAGNKVPDALLMVGLTQDKLGRPAEGRETLARLVALFPETEAGRRAASRLGQAESKL